MGNLFRSKLIVIVIAVGLLIGACVGGILYFVLPTFNANWFAGILLFFIILEILMVMLVERYSRKKDKKQLLNIYMLTKVLKLIASLIFITICILVAKVDIKSFVAVFLALYLLFLAAETLLFTRIEKQIKINETKKDE